MNEPIVSTYQRKCITEIKDNKAIILAGSNATAAVPGGNSGGSDMFTFDYIGGEDCTQEEIFQKVGKPIVDQCLQGYNGSIFAYG
jgi:hypothetical protein